MEQKKEDPFQGITCIKKQISKKISQACTEELSFLAAVDIIPRKSCSGNTSSFEAVLTEWKKQSEHLGKPQSHFSQCAFSVSELSKGTKVYAMNGKDTHGED